MQGIFVSMSATDLKIRVFKNLQWNIGNWKLWTLFVRKKIISIMMHFLHRNVFLIFNILLWEEIFQDPLALRPTCLLWRSRLRYNLPWGLINWLPSLIICYSIIRLRIPYARFHWANLKRYSLKSFPSKVSCYLCTLII